MKQWRPITNHDAITNNTLHMLVSTATQPDSPDPKHIRTHTAFTLIPITIRSWLLHDHTLCVLSCNIPNKSSIPLPTSQYRLLTCAVTKQRLLCWWRFSTASSLGCCDSLLSGIIMLSIRQFSMRSHIPLSFNAAYTFLCTSVRSSPAAYVTALFAPLPMPLPNPK
jgi:hypothetical protein